MVRYIGSRFLLALLALFALVSVPAPAFAQSPTGLLSGLVTSTDKQSLPGATVTLESPALQQSETRVTSANGDYLFKFLPPGQYTVTVNLAGFGASKDVRTIAANESVVLDVTLKVQSVSEEVNVVAPAQTFVNTVLGATNFTEALLSALPTARTVLSAVDLTPGAHDTGPDDAFTINGAATFENVYLLNGVETQDNLRGSPLSLYIEDAIQETTTMTSGISAEYGRFSGGVVDTVTKSGGNIFSGSFRESLSNDNWRTVSPFGEPKVDKTVPESEFTFGGPIMQDRTWFFAAGRVKNNEVGQQTTFTDIPYSQKTDEDRFEGKITQALGPNHRIEIGDIGIRDNESNTSPAGSPVMDLQSLVNRQIPQNQFSVHYTGTYGPHFFLESQFSDRHLAFQNDGGTSTDLIQGTMLLDQLTGATWWAPQFCGVCGDEDRDNSEFVVKGTYFVATGAGSHNLVVGYDTYNDRLTGDNHQSGSDWHVWATTSEIVDGTVYPVIAGGPDGTSTFLIHWPIGQASQGTNFRTHALFANDTWSINRHFSAALGVRYDKNRGLDSAGTLIANGSEISPRLGLVWDPTGSGVTTVSVNADRYVDAIANNIGNETSPAGLPSIFAYFYQGPDINTDPTQPLLTSDQALRQVFDWYNANQPEPFQATVPGVSTQVRQSLKSPHTDEISAALSRQIGKGGALRVDVVDRQFKDFYSERADTSTGQVTDDLGNVYDLRLLENTSLLKRHYTGFDVQGSYRKGTALTVGASYTLSKLRGNDDGEDIGSGPLASDILSYPEYFDNSWSNPIGDLAADQRHRGRAWANVSLPWFDHLLGLSVREDAGSGLPYGAVGPVDTNPYVNNPGYVTPPGDVNYYFTARDAFHTAAMFRTDLGINLNRRLAGGRGVAPEVFAQFQVLNLFNQFQLFDISAGQINTTVLTAFNTTDRFQPFNPFTDTPVQGVNWDFGSKFGQPTDQTAYTLPRTFTVSFGVRF